MQFPGVPGAAWRLLPRRQEGGEGNRQAGGEDEEKRERRRGRRNKVKTMQVMPEGPSPSPNLAPLRCVLFHPVLKVGRWVRPLTFYE